MDENIKPHPLMEAHLARFDAWDKLPRAEKYRPDAAIWAASPPTYIENWPSELHDLSIPSRGITLSREEAETLGSYILEFEKGFEPPKDRENIRARLISALDVMVNNFRNGAFIRLGSRSPKDALYWGCDPDNQLPNGKINSGQMAFDLLTCCSERVYWDLQNQLAMNYEPRIWVRKGVPIPEWAEFRCFMRNRKLVAVSQYNYGAPMPEITEHRGEIIEGIQRFFTFFQKASHLDDVVFDVFIERWGNYFGANLLEINPFFRCTDHCLFDWDDLETRETFELRVVNK